MGFASMERSKRGGTVSEQADEHPVRTRRRDARLVVVTLAAVLLIWFVGANTQKVQIHFWVITADTSLITVILISAALGAILALLLRRTRQRR
jgi:uncharacterized integral membrane protein